MVTEFSFWVNYPFKVLKTGLKVEVCIPAGPDQISCDAGLNSRIKCGSGR